MKLNARKIVSPQGLIILASIFVSIIKAGWVVWTNHYIGRAMYLAAWLMFVRDFWPTFLATIVVLEFCVFLFWLGSRVTRDYPRRLFFTGGTVLGLYLLYNLTILAIYKFFFKQLISIGMLTHQVPEQLTGDFMNKLAPLVKPISEHYTLQSFFKHGLHWTGAVAIVLFIALGTFLFFQLFKLIERMRPSAEISRTFAIQRLPVQSPLFIGQLVIFTILLMQTLGGVSKQSSDLERPNVILISIDTLRADYMSWYDERMDTTFHIDQVASEGVLFRRAISQSNSTLPSHTSMLTGLYPIEHRCNLNQGVKLDPKVNTLAETLLENGYHTIALTSVFFLSDIYGLDQGFQTMVANNDNAYGQVQMAIESIESSPKQPFFLFLHLFDPHDPYMPPKQYQDLFLDPKIDYGNDGDLNKLLEGRNIADLSLNEIHVLRQLYKGEIRYTDNMLQLLFDYLDRNNLAKNTILIITSDHGESFGENGVFNHGTALYSQQIHVPLIIRYPKKIRIPLVFDTLVEASVSIMPTILDLTGITDGESANKHSLLPLLNGIVPQHELAYSENAMAMIPQYSAQDANWKVITFRGENDSANQYSKLFEAVDWTDQTDLSGKYPELVSRYLDTYISEYLKMRTDISELPTMRLTTQDMERLHELGYLK